MYTQQDHKLCALQTLNNSGLFKIDDDKGGESVAENHWQNHQLDLWIAIMQEGKLEHHLRFKPWSNLDNHLLSETRGMTENIPQDVNLYI